MDKVVGGQNKNHENAIVQLRQAIHWERESLSAMDLAAVGMEVDIQAEGGFSVDPLPR